MIIPNAADLFQIHLLANELKYANDEIRLYNFFLRIKKRPKINIQNDY